MWRPRGPLTTWLRAPRESSTARTVAWSPPTRAWETERVTVGAPTTPVVAPVGVTRTGWRYFPLRPFFLPLRLIRFESKEFFLADGQTDRPTPGGAATQRDRSSPLRGEL